jgi:glycosyltransferase involved in cell wall biosynthesis
MGENLVWKAAVQVGSHHYAKLFLKQGDSIFWLSLPWTIFHLLTGIKNERILQWHCGKSKEEQDGLFSYCPLTFLPYRDNIFFRDYRNAERSLKYSLPMVKTVLGKAGFDRVDVLWLTDPRMIGLLGIVEYNVLIYRCVDDLEFFKGIPKNIILLEEAIVKTADVVFATAKPLVQKLKKWISEVYFLPNGVDFFHFYNFQGNEPEDIKEIPRPRVIYVGTLGEWFDTRMIEYAAKQLSNFSFVLVGPIRRDITALNRFKNVFALGQRNYQNIPAYLRYSDVAIIPFEKSKLSDAVNPIKLYEYFAMGLPVVTTDVEEIKNVDSPAIIANSPGDFVAGLEKCLSTYGDKLREEFITFSRGNSWETRFRLVMSLINEKINEKLEMRKCYEASRFR